MKYYLTLLSLLLSVATTINLSAQTELLNETFDTAASIESWMGEPTWSDSAGNPGGAVIVSNDVQPTNKDFTIDIPIDLESDTDMTVKFDAKSITNIAGVFHFYVEPEGFPQYSIHFNQEAEINGDTFTTRTFLVQSVPATATFVTLRFEMITGAVIDADVEVAIDNLEVSANIDPPGTWRGFALVDDFWIENTGQLGWLNVANDPWVYSSGLDIYLYIPEQSRIGQSGAWIYAPLFNMP